MKKLLLTSAFAFISIPAQAGQVPLYLSVGAGLTHTQDSDWDATGFSGSIDIDNSANFSAALGSKVWKNTRAEFEVSYRKADLSNISVDGVGTASLDGDIKTWTFMANGYYDFLEGQKFRPYLSAGIGAAHHKGSISAVGGLGTPGADADDTVFAYQVGAGASYTLSGSTDLWGGYRYLGSSSPDFDGISADYHASELRAGVRFTF